jgi:homoserine dehydrogenase
MNKHLKIGVFGFGCVGQGLYDVLSQTQGIKADIVKICVKDRNKKRKIDSSYFTYDRDEILNNPEIDVVVELIDDATEAYEIAKTALRKGKAVVTANKKMLADNFQELYDLQQIYKIPLLYEGACCASLPIVRNIEEYYDNDLLNALQGILNGTSNYILTKVCDENISYQTALKQAQDLGFAETDPTSDVGGFDTKYKACILTAHAFGVFLKPKDVFNYGIQNLSDYDLQYAREKGYKIKLVAHSRKIENKLAVWVIPQFIPKDNTLYLVDNEYNGVQVEAVFSDKQFFLGKGAGSHPTGSAVLSDISALTYDYKYEYKKLLQGVKLQHTNELFLDVYLRFKDDKVLSELKFETIEEQYRGNGYQYVVGKIKLSTLVNANVLQSEDVFIVQMANNVVELATELKLKEELVLS